MGFFLGILNMLAFIIILGVGLAAIVFVPILLYVIPYYFWLANQQSRGRLKGREKHSLVKHLKYATKLYACWLTGKKPTD